MQLWWAADSSISASDLNTERYRGVCFCVCVVTVVTILPYVKWSGLDLLIGAKQCPSRADGPQGNVISMFLLFSAVDSNSSPLLHLNPPLQTAEDRRAVVYKLLNCKSNRSGDSTGIFHSARLLEPPSSNESEPTRTTWCGTTVSWVYNQRLYRVSLSAVNLDLRQPRNQTL